MGNLSSAVEVTLAKLDLDPRDEGLAELARIYAAHLDEAGDNPTVLKDLGTRLEAVFSALLATPVARVKSPGTSSAGTRLDQFR